MVTYYAYSPKVPDMLQLVEKTIYAELEYRNPPFYQLDFVVLIVDSYAMKASLMQISPFG